MLKRLNEITQTFAFHPLMPLGLFFYAVIESQFLPVPPDVILITLALIRPRESQRFALITTVGSALGGVIGYLIGRYGFEPLAIPILNWFCTRPDALICPNVFVPLLKELFDKHGLWVVAISATASLIPYKVTILAAGIVQMPFIPFFIVSLVMHGVRYCLITFLVARFGQKAIHLVRDQLPIVFTVIAAVVLVIYGLMYYF